MTKMLVYFECEAENFGVVMGKIGTSMALVENFRVETLAEKKHRERKSSALVNHAGGHNTPRQPGLTRETGSHDSRGEPEFRNYRHSMVQQIVLERIKELGNPGVLPADLYDHMASKGYARKSCSPAFTFLRRSGHIEKRQDGRYVLVTAS